VEVAPAHGAGDRGRVEAGSRIAHHDQHSARRVAGDAQLDALVGVVLAAVANGVGERLAQRRLDLELLALRALHLAHLRHHLFDGGRQRLELPGHLLADDDLQGAGVELAAVALVAHAVLVPARRPGGWLAYRKATACGTARTTPAARRPTRRPASTTRRSVRPAGGSRSARRAVRAPRARGRRRGPAPSASWRARRPTRRRRRRRSPTRGRASRAAPSAGR